LQLQAASTHPSVVSGSCNIHRVDHTQMTWLVFVTGRLLDLNMWNEQPLMSASYLETVRYATQHIAKAPAEAPPR
jgi:hypothetical protein